MKTIQKLIAASVFSFLTVSAFGQLNLGVQSATQAAVNATSVARTASSLVTITNTTLQSGVAKAMDVTSKVTSAVQTKADQVLTSASDATENVLANTSMNGSIGVTGNSSANQQAGGSSTSNAGQSINADGDLKANKVNGSASASTASSATISKH